MIKLQMNSLYGTLGNLPAIKPYLEATPQMICQISQNISVKGYKIVDVDEEGYKWLFHGVNGTRRIPFNTWITAHRKWAGEGGHKYWTGFHMFTSKESADKYFNKFTDKKKKRIIINVMGKRLSIKESSHGNVFLAETLFVPEQKYD